jgi:hypothetical protein
MSDLSTLPKGDSAWLLRKAIERIMQQVSVLETNIGSSTTGNSLDGQIIFNDNGTLRGDTGLTYAKSTTTLRAGLLIVPGNTQLATVGILYVGTTANPKLKVDVGANLTTITNATITGDLTVRTNKLLVTSTGVGVGMTPITPLSGVIGTTGAVFFRTTDPAAPVATPYIQAPVATGFSSTAAAYGFWYQDCGISNPAVGAVGIVSGSSERYRIAADGVATWSNVGGFAGTAMTLNSTGLGVKGTVGTASGDAVMAFGARGFIVGNSNASVASGSFIDIAIATTANGYQGFLSVANTQNSNAAVRTQTTFSVFGRGASATFTTIATANGPTAGASFTVTVPSDGVIRITNTVAVFDTTISAQFFGGTSA